MLPLKSHKANQTTLFQAVIIENARKWEALVVEARNRSYLKAKIEVSQVFGLQHPNALAPVVQRLDNAIHRINRYPADKC